MPTNSGVMSLDAGDLIQRSLLLYGEFESATSALMRRLLRPDSVFVDVGANVGSHALAAAQLLPRGRVIAIEASPIVFARLLLNIGLNEHGRLVSPVLGAVGPTDGLVHLTLAPAANSGLGRVAEGGVACGPVVAQFRLEALLHFLGAPNVDLLKMDIEGGEPDVLRGFFDAGFRPAHIVIEYLPDDFARHAGLPDILSGAGYILRSVTGASFNQVAPLPDNNLWASLAADS